MTTTLWIVLGVSAFCAIAFIAAIRSILLENREIDKQIDYDKVRPWVDDEETDDEEIDDENQARRK